MEQLEPLPVFLERKRRLLSWDSCLVTSTLGWMFENTGQSLPNCACWHCKFWVDLHLVQPHELPLSSMPCAISTGLAFCFPKHLRVLCKPASWPLSLTAAPHACLVLVSFPCPFLSHCTWYKSLLHCCSSCLEKYPHSLTRQLILDPSQTCNFPPRPLNVSSPLLLFHSG